MKVQLPRARWPVALVAGLTLVVGCGSTATPVPPGSNSEAPREDAVLDVLAAPELGGPVRGAAAGADGSPANPATGGARTGSAAAAGADEGDLRVPGEPRPPGRRPRPGAGATPLRVGYAFVDQERDAAAFATAHALKIDFGRLEASAEAVVRDRNSRGGVLGRAVELVPRPVDTRKATDDSVNEAQRVCEFFSHDRRVDVVLSMVSGINIDVFFACLAGRGIPVLLLDPNPHSQRAEFERYPGFVYHHATAATERLTPVWVDRLAAQGWFGGWSTSDSTPTPGAARTGILHQANSVGYVDSLRTALVRHRQRLLRTAEYADFGSAARDMANYVFQFKTAGVTHVLVDKPVTLVLFSRMAQSQAYFPRYGVTTLHGPAFLVDNVDPQQLRGVLGVGFMPLADIPNPQRFPHFRQPGSPGVRCDALHAAAGVRHTSQLALLYQHLHCDALDLLDRAFTAGGAVSAPALRHGFALQGAARAAAGPEQVVFGSGRYDGAVAVRDLYYDSRQQRFAYGAGRAKVR